MKGIVGQQIWIMWVLKEREWSKLDDLKIFGRYVLIYISIFENSQIVDGGWDKKFWILNDLYSPLTTNTTMQYSYKTEIAK